MGSIDTATPITGEFMHPYISPGFENDDPWTRPDYGAPPQNMKLVPRRFPLHDIRPLLSDPAYSPTALLKSHGFGVVNAPSSFLAAHTSSDQLTEEGINTIYHPEIESLIKRVTGAKHVYIAHSALRQGSTKSAEPWKLPTGLRPANLKPEEEKAREEEKKKNGGENPRWKPRGFMAAKPIRVPHMDQTPLGARQYIRWDKEVVKKIAGETGVLGKEDGIVEGKGFGADEKDADGIVDQMYNATGGDGLGPRYAAFSIWRPLSKVERDPIALAQRGDPALFAKDYVHWPYLNKLPGDPKLGGDYLKEFAMLGVLSEEAPASAADEAEAVKWYYVSRQEPDEVLFIKLFDSAALGEGGHAPAPYHGSPEIGDVYGTAARESLELRVFCFW